MSEIIIQKQIGFSWKIEIATTRKTETGAKYPDTVETKAQLFGNTETLGQARNEISEAKQYINAQLFGNTETLGQA